MNVLNIDHIERELRNIGARAIHGKVKEWLLSVARNYVLNLDLVSENTTSEYSAYSASPEGVHTYMPPPDQLPSWAKEAIQVGTPIHVFDPTQPRKRAFWQSVETIVDWFNTWPETEPALSRLDRMSFDSAQKSASAWMRGINENPWLHIRDNPPVYKSYDDGMRWVKLSTDAHFEREGNLMGHCVGSGTYSSYSKKGIAEYYSLRDSKNAPHITVEVRLDGPKRKVIQMKGNSNKKPGPKWQPYLVDLVTQPNWLVAGDNSHVDLP